MSEYDEAHPVRANGVVVWRRADGISIEVSADVSHESHGDETAFSVEFLVVHRPRYDDWSFAKGKLDPGETDEECADRELLEETGMRATRNEELTAVRYTDHKGRPKLVRYWLGERVPVGAGGGAFESNDEVDEIAWLGPELARARLSYDHDRGLVDEAMATLRAAHGASSEPS